MCSPRLFCDEHAYFKIFTHSCTVLLFHSLRHLGDRSLQLSLFRNIYKSFSLLPPFLTDVLTILSFRNVMPDVITDALAGVLCAFYLLRWPK